MLVKPKRERDPKYVRWIKTKPCLIYMRVSFASCKGVIDPHHVIPPGGGKAGSKVSDRRCIPLCRQHHELVPSIRALEAVYEINAEEEIRAFNIEYDALFPPTAKRERQRKPNLKVGLQVKGCPECRGEHFFPISKSSMFEIGAAGIVGFMCLTKRKWVAA